MRLFNASRAIVYDFISGVAEFDTGASRRDKKRLDFTSQGFARFRLSARTSSRQDLMPAVIYDLTVRSIRPVDFNFNSFAFDSALIDLRKNDEF